MTQLLLLWSLSNALLASLILSTSNVSTTFNDGANTRTGVYMLCILSESNLIVAAQTNTSVFVAGMAMFRFIASTLYLIVRLFGG